MRAQSKARSATDSITPLPFFWTGHPRYPNLDGQRLAIEKAHRFCVATKSATQNKTLQRKVQRSHLRCACAVTAQFLAEDSRSPVGTTSTGQAA